MRATAHTTSARSPAAAKTSRLLPRPAMASGATSMTTASVTSRDPDTIFSA